MATAIILNDTSHMNHHGCRRVVSNLRLGLNRHGFEVIGSWHGLTYLRDQRFRDQLRVADALIVNGEGTIHHNRPAARALVESAGLAAAAGCPAFLINTTWQENSDELARATERFAMVRVRESLSLQALEGQHRDLDVVPDLTFYNGASPSPERGDRIAVTDSTRKDVNRQLFRFASMRPECDFLPVLAPFSPKPGMPKRVRRTMRHAAYAALRRIPALSQTVPPHYHALTFARPDVDAYLGALRASAGVITGRFHSLCFALQTATPFLAVRSNSHKIEALLRDVGLPERRLLTVEELTSEALGRNELTSFAARELEHVSAYVTDAPRRIDAMFAQIARITLGRSADRRVA